MRFWLLPASLGLLLAAAAPPPSPDPGACRPTWDDGVSPTYKADMPFRTTVGHGHVLTGTVIAGENCLPIAEALVEVWPEYENRGHPDAARASLLTDEEGRFRFECDQPEHIHMRISADGYRTIGVNSYHPEGSPKGSIQIVLARVS